MGGRSESVSAVLADPVRGTSVGVTLPAGSGPLMTLGEFLSFYRAAAADPDAPGLSVADRRFADGLFPAGQGGTLGALDAGLRFSTAGKPCGLDYPIAAGRPARFEVDRSLTGYSRNWPAHLARRWGLRADAYSGFVGRAVEGAYGRGTGDVLRLDSPDRVRRFLAAVAAQIHAAPYETYSRYLEPKVVFKGCDEALDRIIEGDGGVCAEKAMALVFIATAYGIETEVVLGGEDASGSFPYQALRAILDSASFDFGGTAGAQRYWQHYAVLCRLPGVDDDFVFCDVADSNIPFLCWDARQAAPYLSTARKQSLRVTVTLEPLSLYYHRLERRQDLPLDLYYAMEHLIDAVDVVQTVDNELGLLHAGDFWVGAVAYRNPRERDAIVREYGRYASRGGLDPRRDVCFARDLNASGHPLADRFRAAHPRGADRVAAAGPGLRGRLAASSPGHDFEYVLIKLPERSPPPTHGAPRPWTTPR